MNMIVKDFRKMSLQEIFDHSTRGIISQGGPCYDSENKKCLYSYDEKHCAAGWVLPKAQEDVAVSEVIRDLYGEDDFEPKATTLLMHLQERHDNSARYQAEVYPLPHNIDKKVFWKDWKQALEDFLYDYNDEFNLDASVLKEIPCE